MAGKKTSVVAGLKVASCELKKPATRNPQPATSNPQPATSNQQPAPPPAKPMPFKLMPTRDALDRSCYCIIGPDGSILKDAGRVLKIVDPDLAERIRHALEHKLN